MEVERQRDAPKREGGTAGLDRFFYLTDRKGEKVDMWAPPEVREPSSIEHQNWRGASDSMRISVLGSGTRHVTAKKKKRKKVSLRNTRATAKQQLF